MEAGRYAIWIVTPPGYRHSRCFEEVALCLRDAFAALGYVAPIVVDPAQVTGTAIILGANLLEPGQTPPAGSIVYNLEQIDADSVWTNPNYFSLLSANRVWDYSRLNVAALARRGVKAALCEIGYMPVLTRITPASELDIDVAFVGSINQRRYDVLKRLDDAGKIVFGGFDLYGTERDEIFSRAKIVLNVHFYESKVLEIVRVSYLLANRLCVVSETGQDRELEESLQDAIAFAPYAGVVDTCLRLLEDASARNRLATAGFDSFSRRDQVASLKAALALTQDKS